MAVTSHTTVFVFADFTLDPERRLLMRGDEPVALHPKAFELLQMLVENNDRVLTKNEILNTIWEGQFVEENNLAVQISALRKVFGETGKEHRFIVTLPGRGYRFVSPVGYENHKPPSPPIEFEQLNGSVNGESAATLDRIPWPDTGEETRASRKNYLFWSGLGILLLAGLSAVLFWRELNKDGSAAQPAANRLSSPLVQISSARRVTRTGSARTAAISPDGKMFLYSSGDRGQTGLWLGHVDGGEHIELRPRGDAKFRGLAFAPDGESIYYVVASEYSQEGALYKSSILGGVPEKLRDIVNTQIAIAPDATQFAYVRADPKAKTSALIVAELGGANEREVASRAIDQSFAWETPSWSPDGKMISVAAAVDGEVSEIFIASMDAGTIKPLTNEMKWSAVRATDWLKDGTGLLVSGTAKNSWASCQLFHVSYPSGVIRNVNPDLTIYSSSLKLASNGTLLTTQVQRIGNIWIAPASDLANAKQITFGSLERLDGWWHLSWTPDGNLLHSAIVGNFLTIWKTDPRSGKQQQVTSSNFTSNRAGLTDDGRFLVFESTQSGSPEIWRSDLSGENARQITSGGDNSWPHVSPDGRWIAFRKPDGFLWRMTIDGTDELRLTEVPANMPRFSPDNRYIACVYGADDERQTIAILSIDGGPPIKVFSVPPSANFSLGLRWTRDANAVTYRDWEHGIWRQDISGGGPERLKGLPKEKIYGYDWSHEGNEFAFTYGSNMSDVVLVTLDPNSSR